MSSRFTEECEAGRALRYMFERGQISAEDPPVRVWSNKDLFQQYKLNTFKAKFNKMKKEFDVTRDTICKFKCYFLKKSNHITK